MRRCCPCVLQPHNCQLYSTFNSEPKMVCDHHHWVLNTVGASIIILCLCSCSVMLDDSAPRRGCPLTKKVCNLWNQPQTTERHVSQCNNWWQQCALQPSKWLWYIREFISIVEFAKEESVFSNYEYKEHFIYPLPPSCTSHAAMYLHVDVGLPVFTL